jgi:hypothetical protein
LTLSGFKSTKSVNDIHISVSKVIADIFSSGVCC